MTLPLPATRNGTFREEAAEPALRFLDGCDAFALGPGLATDPETAPFVEHVAHEASCPGVVDADGLNHLARLRRSVTLRAHGPRVMTPHPGEAARLLRSSIRDVTSDRKAALERLRKERGAVIVLKGRGTLVGDAERIYENGTGNPGMATGGTGDVLTGLVAALLAQGFDPFDAAVLAVWAHGRAGDLAAEALGEASVIADDVLDRLPAALRERTEAAGPGAGQSRSTR
jgi:NAD(P)H-hydrate epimerase